MSAFQEYPIGLVQLEIIQGVGGVREIPEKILQHLKQLRDQHKCLLFVDEVQTGVFRTGPFVRSRSLDIEPDILTIGKAASDMMFPFAMTLYNDDVQSKLESRNCSLKHVLDCRYGYDFGYRTLLNTLRRTEEEKIEETICEREKQFKERLEELSSKCRHVKDIRVYGMLIGIELNVDNFRYRWLKRLVPRLFLLSMLRHPNFPLLMGFCQYEPNVLKFTPPLSICEEEVESVCQTISSVLQSSPMKLTFKALIYRLLNQK